MKRTLLRLLPLLCILAPAFLALHCGKSENAKMTQEFTQFLKSFEEKYIPLSKEAGIAYFNATISGKDEDYKKAEELETRRTKIFANKAEFAELKRFKESGAITDPLLARQLTVLYNAYLGKQIDEKKIEAMIALQMETEKLFSTFRASVAGKQLTDNEIEELLKNSKDQKELEAAWTASKQVGGVVSQNVLRLVKMRNEAAKELGFPNYHAMQLQLGEQDPKEIETLFDELDNLTRDTFARLKGEVDSALAARLGIPKDQLMPWDYQNRFFQEAPKLYNVDLDGFYKDKNIVDLASAYYAGIGLPIADLIPKSDLYEKPGKYQHAYCTDIDRQGDVRVVCNIKPNYNWMNTTLHEYGHAVYDRHKDFSAPWLLREPAHTFTTEAVAMLFGRMASNAAWLKEVAGVPAAQVDAVAEEGFKSLRLEQLVFSRWAQVMYRFEKAMYENPDQDLNKLWWDLVERYQMLRRPAGRNAPDWASKIHVALYPAYYHNYLMGELLASQLNHYIVVNILKADPATRPCYAGRADVGAFLREKMFNVGSTLYWNDMIEQATGEKLTAKYYAEQFVK
jgi:peptidyl-dipeptidase A